MSGIRNSIYLGVGNISNDSFLGKYYQNIAPGIVHIEEGIFAKLDENGIPYLPKENSRYYAAVLIIQYGLMNIDLYLDSQNASFLETTKKCIEYLENKKETLGDSIVWKSPFSERYNLPDGWVSGMYQGQAISLYLRYYQITKENQFLETAELVFNSFKYTVEEGGFMRHDSEGNLWFEEYPTKEPSLVLNGFLYSMLGLFDLYRVTQRQDVHEVWLSCVNTLENSLHKYDLRYWSVYDQMKEELVSFYYQKNVHVPLMEIMYGITGKEIFDYYKRKWERNLSNPLHGLITKIMYRVQPRMKILKK